MSAVHDIHDILALFRSLLTLSLFYVALTQGPLWPATSAASVTSFMGLPTTIIAISSTKSMTLAHLGIRNCRMRSYITLQWRAYFHWCIPRVVSFITIFFNHEDDCLMITIRILFAYLPRHWSEKSVAYKGKVSNRPYAFFVECKLVTCI